MCARARTRVCVGICAIVNGLLWATFVLYSVHANLPHNTIALPFESKVDLRIVAPQGWAFFTRDAEEEQLTTYALRDGTWQPLNAEPNASVANLFGVSRRGRARSNEAGTLLQTISRGDWTDCSMALNDCFNASHTSSHVRNAIPEPALCGDVGFVLRRPVPWAWASSKKPVVMPARVVRMEVRC